jgi:hypothetical protein
MNCFEQLFPDLDLLLYSFMITASAFLGWYLYDILQWVKSKINKRTESSYIPPPYFNTPLGDLLGGTLGQNLGQHSPQFDPFRQAQGLPPQFREAYYHEQMIMAENMRRYEAQYSNSRTHTKDKSGEIVVEGEVVSRGEVLKLSSEKEES